MDLYKWMPVAGEMEICLIDIPEVFQPGLEAQIEKIWQIESQKKKIENRKIVTLVAIQPQRIVCRIANYRDFFVQTVHPELKEQMQICPIAVCGITRNENRFLVGKRAKDVLQYPGMYEFVPSGSLDAEHPDPKKQILQELREESGIGEDRVKSSELTFLVRDAASPLVELCYLIETEETKICPSAEYLELLWMSQNEVLRSFSNRDWVPLSKQFFQKIF